MCHMEPELALATRTIDSTLLGQRIKSARLAAGLTQRQLAGDGLTAGYVSRIEDGSRRPSVSDLERMAEMIGTTLAALVAQPEPADQPQLRLRLDHAELALLSGDCQRAFDEAVEAEAEIERRALEGAAGDPVLLVDARFIRAAALEGLGRLNDAVRLLEDITSQPEPSVRWVKALIALCRCHKEQGNLNEAIAVGDRVTPLISDLGLDGLTESIQLSVSVAGAYMKRGDLDCAMRLCDRAVAAAEKVGSPIAKASAYWNASLVEGRRGAHQSALTLAQRALASFEEGEDFRNIGRLRTQVAAMQLRNDPPDPEGALRRLEVAEQELSWSSASPMDKADHFLVRARAIFLTGDTIQAERSLSTAEELLGDSAPLLRAEAEALRGRIAISGREVDEARRHYAAAVHLLTGVGSDRDAAQLWFELAGLLDRAGDRDGALDAYRSAAAVTGFASGGMPMPSARASSHG